MKHKTGLKYLVAIAAIHAFGVANAAADERLASARAWLDSNAPELSGDVLSDAAREGALMLYCLNSSCPPGLLDAFQEVFPFINVNIYRASGGALAERFSSEVRAGQRIADIVMNSSPATLDRFVDEGLIASFAPSNGDLVPEEFRQDGYWYGIGLLHMGVSWNTDQVTEEEEQWLGSIRNWTDIANPAFKGRSVMGHIRGGGTQQIVYYYLKETLGPSYFEDLKTALEPVIYDSSNPASERIAAGEYAYMPHGPVDIGALANLIDRGAPIGFNLLEPGLALPYAAAISEAAPHPNAAKLFMAWTVSLEGQSAYVNNVGMAPMRPDIDDRRPLAQSKYYRLPGHYYNADWDSIGGELGGMEAEFRRVYSQ